MVWYLPMNQTLLRPLPSSLVGLASRQDSSLAFICKNQISLSLEKFNINVVLMCGKYGWTTEGMRQTELHDKGAPEEAATHINLEKVGGASRGGASDDGGLQSPQIHRTNDWGETDGNNHSDYVVLVGIRAPVVNNIYVFGERRLVRSVRLRLGRSSAATSLRALTWRALVSLTISLMDLEPQVLCLIVLLQLDAGTAADHDFGVVVSLIVFDLFELEFELSHALLQYSHTEFVRSQGPQRGRPGSHRVLRCALLVGVTGQVVQSVPVGSVSMRRCGTGLRVDSKQQPVRIQEGDETFSHGGIIDCSVRLMPHFGAAQLFSVAGRRYRKVEIAFHDHLARTHSALSHSRACSFFDLALPSLPLDSLSQQEWEISSVNSHERGSGALEPHPAGTAKSALLSLQLLATTDVLGPSPDSCF
ncbi:hypothetical protein KCU83_g22, partial [Aureobasidium melanogenum]